MSNHRNISFWKIMTEYFNKFIKKSVLYNKYRLFKAKVLSDLNEFDHEMKFFHDIVLASKLKTSYPALEVSLVF